jgi:oligopeptide transport system substrate-binding protein
MVVNRSRRGRRIAGLAALALVISACGGGGEKAAGNGVFTFANQEPQHLTPGNENSSYGINVIDALFDRLTRLDKEGKPQMNGAESITSDDQKTWKIKVKSGQTFHNGEPVTAQSYADAWNAAAYGPNAWANNYYFANIEGYDELNPDDEKAKPSGETLSGVKVVDESTFEVTLTEPFSQFPLTLAFAGFAPMPKAAFKDLKAYDEAPIGNGPFMMDGTWEHNKQIALKRYAGYKGSRPAKAAGVVFKTYASRDTAYTDLVAGKVDWLETIPAAKVPEAKTQMADRFLSTPTGDMDYLEFPIYDKRFQNQDLRYAISMAIDREGIVQQVYNGAYKPTGTIVSPIVPGYREGACGAPCTYNPQQAKAYFEKAGGWKGTMELWFSVADPTYEQWMQAVANQLKQNLGISDIKFRKISAADYLDKLNNKEATGPYRANWVMDYPSAENYLTTRCNPDNRMGYAGDACFDLIKQGNAAGSLDESQRFYQQAEDVLLKELPILPLWNWQDQSGHSNKIDNVNVDPYVGLHVDEVSVK